jgi:hypothetical protein
LHWNRDHPARDDRRFRRDTFVAGGVFFDGPLIQTGRVKQPAI